MVKQEANQKVLDSLTIEAIAQLITSGRVQKESVIVLVGAGMSTSAGVPDFRSPSSGIYEMLKQTGVANPIEVFTLRYFKKNPKPFFDVCKALLPDKLYPTLAHYFIKLLDNKQLLLRCYSQNVDGLELLTGLNKDRLVLAHGTFATGHCMSCRSEVSLRWIKERIEAGKVPHCQTCNGVIKPDVKLFGEPLDPRFFRLLREDFHRCKLLIIVGTSLSVLPFADLPRLVPPTCPRLVINISPLSSQLEAPVMMRIAMRVAQLVTSGGWSSALSSSTPSSKLRLDRPDNERDVAFTGTCDDGTAVLARLLGWREELEMLANNGRQELNSSYEAGEL